MDRPVKLVLCWHMHQPYYRDELHGEYLLPWVYLHAMKDYTDMAWHLERHPGMRTVVNFTPVLLEQLLDYSARIAEYLDSGREMNDRMLNLLAGVTPIPRDTGERLRIIGDCQRCKLAGGEAEPPGDAERIATTNSAALNSTQHCLKSTRKSNTRWML